MRGLTAATKGRRGQSQMTSSHAGLWLVNYGFLIFEVSCAGQQKQAWATA
jgi:hypothetical protein